MELGILVEAFTKLETITSRIQITAILVDLFKKTPPELIDKVVYLIQGKLWPDWKGLPELGVGEKFLIKAIAKSTHSKEAEVEELYKKMGDLGKVAEALKGKVASAGGVGLAKFLGGTTSQKKLTVDEVYRTLTRVATATGEGRGT